MLLDIQSTIVTSLSLYGQLICAQKVIALVVCPAAFVPVQ
jgi:hypothetical protein